MYFCSVGLGIVMNEPQYLGILQTYLSLHTHLIQTNFILVD